MADLDTLRPEVREAVSRHSLYMDYPYADVTERAVWNAILAELLRLADENKRMRGIIETLDIEGHRRAEKAEAKLAALKARIAEAQECGVVALCGGGASLSHEPYPSLVGKRVRLVVENDNG